MSDKLSALLQRASIIASPKQEDPDKRLEFALEKALASTTPERPGCPWDDLEEQSDRPENGIWIPSGD